MAKHTQTIRRQGLKLIKRQKYFSMIVHSHMLISCDQYSQKIHKFYKDIWRFWKYILKKNFQYVLQPYSQTR